MEDFRSAEDLKTWAEKQSQELKKTLNMLDAQGVRIESASGEYLDISSNRSKKGYKQVKVNTDFPKIVIPGMKTLQTKYKTAELLHEQYLSVQEAESIAKMKFPKATEVLGELNKLRNQVAAALTGLMQWLNNVARKHVPEEFRNYANAVGQELTRALKFKSSESYLYVSTDVSGKLVFTGYIKLLKVSSGNRITPQLYVVIQWNVDEQTTRIFLEPDFAIPSKLKGGVAVTSVKEAIKEIGNQLELEGFSNELGNLPIEYNLKSKPEDLSKEHFSVKNSIKTVKVVNDSLVFVLKPGLDSKKMDSIKEQLFLDVKKLLKRPTKSRISMQGQGQTVRFFISDFENNINRADLEWLKDKYGLDNSQVGKIIHTMNSK